MQFAANFLAQFALFTIFFVKQSLSQSLTSGFAGLTPPSGFAQPSFAQPSYSSFFPPGYSQPSGLTPQLMPYKSNLNSYPGLGGYSSYISPYTYGDSHTVGSILQPSGGGIERPERNEYYSTYNAYNNQAAYPRYSGAGNGLNSFNYPSSFSSAYSPPNFATGYSPPNFGNSGLGTGYLEYLGFLTTSTTPISMKFIEMAVEQYLCQRSLEKGEPYTRDYHLINHSASAYPRYSGAGNGLNSFNYPSSFSSAYSPPNFATGYSPPNFGNSGLGTGYLG